MTTVDVQVSSARVPSRPYVGLATRGLAFILDAAIVNGTALFAVVGAGLIASILQLPDSLRTAAIASGSVLYSRRGGRARQARPGA